MIENNPYALVLDFSGVATNKVLDSSKTIEAGYDFIVEGVAFAAWLASTVSNVGAAGTPLARDPDPSPTSTENNTAPFLHMVQLKVTDTMDDVWYSDFASVALVTGDGRQPAIPITQRRIRAGATVTATVRNQCGQTIDAQLVVLGRRVRRGSV